MSLLSRGYNRSPCGRREKEDRRFHYRLRCPRARGRARLCRSISGGLTKFSVCFSLNCALTSNPLNLERPCRLAAYSSHSRHRLSDLRSHRRAIDCECARVTSAITHQDGPANDPNGRRSKYAVRGFFQNLSFVLLRSLSDNRRLRARCVQTNSRVSTFVHFRLSYVITRQFVEPEIQTWPAHCSTRFGEHG